MILIMIFVLESLLIMRTTSLNQQENYKERLAECEENLNPVYQQPAELLRSWQNCRISLLEEKQRVRVLETTLDKKTDSSCMETTPSSGMSTISPKPIGVEGRWVQKMDKVQHPQGAVQNLNEGDLIAWPDYVARTWIGENTVPCRTNFDICWVWWDGKMMNGKLNEILVGNYAWRWTNSSVPIPNNALIGGYRVIPGTDARETLYVGRAIYDDFINHNFTTNQLLLGYVDGQTRELVQTAWFSTQRKTTYQILVKP